MKKIPIANKELPLFFSDNACNEVENKLDINFDKSSFGLTVDWITNFYRCLNQVPSMVDSFKKSGKYWLCNLEFMELFIGYAHISILVDIYGYRGLYIKSFTFINNGPFSSLFENKGKITALAEFHSWIKRLDEVKGARPTFWC